MAPEGIHSEPSDTPETLSDSAKTTLEQYMYVYSCHSPPLKAAGTGSDCYKANIGANGEFHSPSKLFPNSARVKAPQTEPLTSPEGATNISRRCH